MSASTSYPMTKSMRSILLIAGVLLILLVVTIPVAIYFLSRRSGKLELDATGFTVRGLGLTQRWEFADLARIGILRLQIIGGLAVAVHGPVMQHLCAITKQGKKRSFVLTRFERSQEILDRIAAATRLPVEEVRRGALGPSFPAAAAR